jgi:hypothetical protein
MTPTRDRLTIGPQVDTGTGTPPAPRLDTWAYGGVPDVPVIDTGIGSPVAARYDTLDSGDSFIPPLWL